MPTTLSRLPPLLPRLAALCRTPFWAQALALCALFAIAGAAVVDDYGVSGDEATQRQIARANADYIATGSADALHYRDYRYYGIAFELPLLMAERALGLQDSRRIYLTRHLLIHLFFIAGGFACGMLAYRMVGSRWIALFAMTLFLLHPRLYAHSFFNSKDVPFAAMLLIALCLAHRAFRKDTLSAFLLCGVCVGLAINLRPFALMLLPMIIAMRALDLWQASSGAERKRILGLAGIFAAAALATAYIAHPHYWENPLRFIEGVRTLSQHPSLVENLFMGAIYPSDAVPWNYIPVWFAITAPPAALLLGAIGCAAVCCWAITHPIAALRDRETRFSVLLLGCFALPVVVVIALQSNIYNGWRQMYFLWGPFCLLAAIGLHHIANIHMRMGIWRIGARLPGRIRGGALGRALAYGVAGAGLITTLTAMAALHPYEYVYFNPLVDTKTPGAPGNRYEMDYWELAQRQSLEYLLARYPDGALRVWPKTHNALVLPQDDRKRILLSSPQEADFYIKRRVNRWNDTAEPAIHDIRAYGGGIAFILDPSSADYRDYHRAEYHAIAANGTLLARSDFDIYAHNGEMRYLKEDCGTLPSDARFRVFLHITPVAPADLPAHRRELGFENRDFWIAAHSAFFEGKCILKRALPDYPIARVSTGQKAVSSGGVEWRSDIDLAARAAAQAVYESVAAGDYGLSAAQSDFDVYIRDGALAYVKENCYQGDADARFFLHIFPADPANLPAGWRERGLANLDFQFAEHGAYVGDKCVAARELPAYPIERIRTGQLVNGAVAWRADIDLATLAAARAVFAGITAGDYGNPVAQSHFDAYMRGNALAYLKENCEAGDVDARFFLHITSTNPADLPADRREYGFVNLDFQFTDHGARIGDKCVAERELPDYAIERIRTGQKATAPGGTEWRADINPAALAAARATTQALYESVTAGDYGPPVAQSHFDLYLRDNALTYLKAPCAAGDTHARFFLHITPVNHADLPAPNRERGFANLDFHFADHGAYAGGICAATIDLPNYPIDRIHTGQFVSGEGSLWRVEFPAAR